MKIIKAKKVYICEGGTTCRGGQGPYVYNLEEQLPYLIGGKIVDGQTGKVAFTWNREEWQWEEVV